MTSHQVQIEESWKDLLAGEFEKPYFEEIRKFLYAEKDAGKTIYPPGGLIFNAFTLTPVDQLKVIILGQDPYHNPGEAMGLCFSVPAGVKIPPSLNNIYKELKNDVGFDHPGHGDLSQWARQGVLLLNAFLTVEKNKPLSHSKIGWQHFTDAELHVMTGNIVKNLKPEDSMAMFKYMIPALNQPERIALLGGVKLAAPPQVMDAIFTTVGPYLLDKDYNSLRLAVA